MKKTLVSIYLLILASCGSTRNVDRFYEAHKNDDQVTAIRGPRVMLTMISGISPDMEALVGRTKELRYMQFPSSTPARTEFLNQQMTTMTGNSFLEVYRKNDQLKRHVVAIREKGNSVKEILVYKNNNVNGSFLYFNGDFDPVKVRELAMANHFDGFSEALLLQFIPHTISE
jgi:hypothetical protein